jgi:excisionase family DNA binding protein
MTADRPAPNLLLPAEVADLFGVDVQTLRRWARAGKLPGIVLTLGGHRRYDRATMLRLRDQGWNPDHRATTA